MSIENIKLFNTLSTVISSQIQLTNILSGNYYKQSVIDQKLSGLAELDQNMESFDQSLEELSKKLDALSGPAQPDMSYITSGQLDRHYTNVSNLENAFDF